MDIQNRNVGPFEQYCIDEFSMCHDDGDFERDADGFYESIETERLWRIWELQIAKAQAVPEGFVLVKKANRIGNPNVDFSQAPRWAKYWLKDGHSNKYWWSSTRPIKDMDLQAFCWRGDYFAEEAPSFNFAGSWDKSLTSKKAMIEPQEPAND